MTPEKALQIIKNEIYADGKERAEVMRVIEEAVGKQIAKKPESRYYSQWDVKYFSCPVCGRLWWEKAFTGDYCDKCGQKLKESDKP